VKGILVDSSIILDVFEDDPEWADWSLTQLEKWADIQPLYINQIIYAEVSIGFQRIETLEEALAGCGFRMIQ
ncbi:MAG: DNA-binding protein, partial [candidate division Zixibacteria bacterium]|nr:DNA-binding protein [candidate division Zixibacteria bacterium]